MSSVEPPKLRANPGPKKDFVKCRSIRAQRNFVSSDKTPDVGPHMLFRLEFEVADRQKLFGQIPFWGAHNPSDEIGPNCGSHIGR